MIIEFGHPRLGEEVVARAGYYVPLEEHVLPYEGREVIYIVGHGCIDNSCCGGRGSWGYVQVPGFLVRRHVRGGTSSPVSEVEIIEGEATRDRIRESLLKQHPGAQIDMWDTSYR
ncbi:MAG: hypothetical protein NTU41_01800 [Chloroflexi bacterium]|nr:hypothetical protein [Chloroflexota bacterium]